MCSISRLRQKIRSFRIVIHPIASVPMAVAPTTSAPKATARDAKLLLTWTFVINPSYFSLQQEALKFFP